MIGRDTHPTNRNDFFLSLGDNPIMSDKIQTIKHKVRFPYVYNTLPPRIRQNEGILFKTAEDNDLSIRTFCRRDVCIGFVQQEGHDVLVQVETLRVRVNHRLTACESRQHAGFDLSQVTDAEFMSRRSRE